jgi:small GTP-binding protein
MMAQKSFTIALAGNPNSGKTTTFNNITGTRQKVGNWPGVTVEKKEGTVNKFGYDLTIIDLPGTYSLTPFSIEEIIARDFVLEECPDVVIDIIDATNLERSLYLATQLRETDCKVLFALNMADLAKTRGIKIDAKKLSDAVLSTDDDTIIGIVPDDYANQARRLDYDPFNDARYTQDSIDLVLSALKNATLHQKSDQKKSRTGGYTYPGSFIWHSQRRVDDDFYL